MFRIKNVPSLPAHQSTNKPSNLLLSNKQTVSRANSHNNKQISLNAVRVNVREKRERFYRKDQPIQPKNNKFQIRNKTNLKPLREENKAVRKQVVHRSMGVEENKNGKLQPEKQFALRSMGKVQKQGLNKTEDNLEREGKDEQVKMAIEQQQKQQIEELPKGVNDQIELKKQREIEEAEELGKIQEQLKKKEEQRLREQQIWKQKEKQRERQREQEEQRRKVREQQEKKDQERRQMQYRVMMAKIYERKRKERESYQKQKQMRDKYWKRFEQVKENTSTCYGCKVGGVIVAQNPLLHFEMDNIVVDAQVYKVLQLESDNFPSGPAIEKIKQQLQIINKQYMSMRFDSDKERLLEGLKGYRIELMNKIGDLIMADRDNGYQDAKVLIMEEDRGGEINRQVNLIKGIPKSKIHRVVSEIECSLDSDCNICLQLIKAGEVCSQLVCGHIFHTDCLNDWVQSTANCPACRKNLKQ